ncbi:MAG: phage tail protein, partial [Bacteroidota bacterium]
MTVETEAIEYREGTNLEHTKLKMPGLVKYGNITMKRGYIQGDNDFVNWFQTIALNTVERRDLTISLLNEAHEPVVTWQVKNAFPVKVESTDLKADGNEVAIESIEIAHEGLAIING